MNCLNCNAETTNGLALCALCTRKATADLEFLPVYFRNLARWRRPARPNGSLGARGQWLIRAGESDDANRIGKALDKAGNMLATWANALSEERDIETPAADSEAEQARALCDWLTEHLTTVSTMEWCGQLARDLTKHERSLRELTETAVPGWYSGACRRCTAPTYVVPGLTWVKCQSCGATTYARDHLDVILDEARGWVARPKRLAEAIVALVDTEQSIERLHDRIRQWGSREMVTAIRRIDEDGDEVGPRRYRLGEVIDQVFAEGTTRLSSPTRSVSA